MLTPKNPLFSIVIPTRNRAHLLPHAIQSALEQDFDNYEIVIVANDCQDNTREIVHSFSDDRIRYFETDRMLTMPENWEFAWTKARGKYVTYLSDDDGLISTTLSYLEKEALHDSPLVVSWEDAIYYYPDWHDTKMQNVLLLFFFGDCLMEDVETYSLRKKLAHFQFKWSEPIPKLLNCLVRRDYFDQWRHRLGQLFFPIAPDYSFAWIATHVCESIRIIHKPFSVRGISDHSIGSNAGLHSAGQNFYKEFGNLDFFKETKNHLPLSINHLAATYLRINASLQKNHITPEPLDPISFNVALANQLVECRHLLPQWENEVKIYLKQCQSKSFLLYRKIKKILEKEPAPESIESLRELHARTKRLSLENESHYTNAVTHHDQDEDCALCILAQKNQLLVDKDWSYLYLFGEALNAHSIYSIGQHVDSYYDLMLKCRKKQQLARQKTRETFYVL